MLLYIIRHGSPCYDPDSLTPLGKRQAEAVGHRLSVHGLDEVYSSPMIRAQQTAQPTCEMLGLEYQIEEWTSEGVAWHYFAAPDENGHKRWAFAGKGVFFRQNPEFLGPDWYKAPCLANCQAFDGFEYIKKSSDDFLARQGYLHEADGTYRVTEENDKRVAVFCHAGFGSTWISALLGCYPTFVWSTMDMTHTGITIFHLKGHPGDHTLPVMLTLSDTSHLYGERLPLEYNGYLKI